MSTESPNPLKVALSVLSAMRRRPPAPSGAGSVDHSALDPILGAVAARGVEALPALRGDLAVYRKTLEDVDPDSLTPPEALAFWLNLYNAGALDLAADARDRTDPTVLRVPGGFSRPWATIAGEELSLDAIEHAKLRRFQDGRIHGALVCGAASCPTLRFEAYRGADVDAQLDDQMRTFLASGGAIADRQRNRLLLSRIFLWFGADFVRPHRMPTWVPASRRRIHRALQPWLDPELVAWVAASGAKIEFRPYDWSLACTVR